MVVVVEDEDVVEGLVQLASVVEVEVAELSAERVELKEAPPIHEYAILFLSPVPVGILFLL